MDDPAEPFKDYVEMHEYAERNDLDYAWEGTALFERRRRTLPPVSPPIHTWAVSAQHARGNA
jgi:hypothetical protein